MASLGGVVECLVASYEKFETIVSYLTRDQTRLITDAILLKDQRIPSLLMSS
ncbi:hypothetical protein M404DRAFT_837410 [Pisolithus tinctorius Marx 270]|uniref:Uncharacterized protein n=1 Tax=Pisolithus tinctorius Marx 270 TaxID=870435 RepID=A0A0C3PQE4_PISTI|nr:hypothetical protein M404DRAFT_837410 [Pisolithus tinctorius Marx 270]